MPAAVNRLTAAGKAVRRRKATIYRDFPAVADRFARRGKPKTAAADKHFVVVTDPTDIQYHIIKPYIDRFLQSYICRLYLPSTALHATARIRIYLLLCCMQQLHQRVLNPMCLTRAAPAEFADRSIETPRALSTYRDHTHAADQQGECKLKILDAVRKRGVTMHVLICSFSSRDHRHVIL